jgi:ABC-type glutathione transport system ATPase component
VPTGEAQALLAARDVVRRFPARGRKWRTGPASHAALDGATLELHEGEIVGLVGRSGAGKSTLGRVLLGLERPDAGEVTFRGRPLSVMTSSCLHALRREVQVVFQDPQAALDPRQRIVQIIAEPLAIHCVVPRRERRERAAYLLDKVGLPGDPRFLQCRPGELSGGERQRVAIARAIAAGPKALILDEPVSALDASVRGQVLNLLIELHEHSGLSLLVIVHDLALVAGLCTRVAVMALGRIVEEGAPEVLLGHPVSGATRELVAAARSLTRGAARGTPNEPPAVR